MSASQSTPRPPYEWPEMYDRASYPYRILDALSRGCISIGKAHEAIAHFLAAGTEDAFADDGDIWDKLEKARAELAALREEKAARADEDELTDAISKMMGDLLTQTANALKGEPPPLTLHDWSDLPVKVAALRERHDQAVVAVRQLMDDYSSMIDSEWGWSEPEKNADPDTHQSSGYILGRRVLAAETAAEKQ